MLLDCKFIRFLRFVWTNSPHKRPVLTGASLMREEPRVIRIACTEHHRRPWQSIPQTSAIESRSKFALKLLLQVALLIWVLPTTVVGSNTSDAGEESPGSNHIDKGHGFIGFRTGYYHNNDTGDGNPFLDEQLTVIEPVIIYDRNVTDNLAIWGKLSYDYVSSASIERLNKFPRQSSASGDYYFGLDTGVRYRLSDNLRVGGFLSASTEFDYDSFGAGANIIRDSNDKNTTVKLNVNGFLDTIDIIRFNGVESEGKDERDSLSSTFTWYQIFSPKVHGEFGMTFSYQTGFLETAFNSVVVENENFPPNLNFDNNAQGFESAENLPSKRIRGAAFCRVRRYFRPRTAIELGGRIYSDTWGINSASIEPQLHQWLIDDVLNLRLRYRYYLQSDSKYFEDLFTFDEFLNGTRYRTQDSDLGDFDSHTLGLKLNFYLSEFLRLDISGDYVLRSDGINQIIASFGLTRDF